jgi:hypothetical protein
MRGPDAAAVAAMVLGELAEQRGDLGERRPPTISRGTSHSSDKRGRYVSVSKKVE